MALGRLLSGFITILVGVTLLPTIAAEVHVALYNGTGDEDTAGTNVTGAAYTITNLSTLFFALGVMSIGIGIAVGGLRDAGLV